MKDIFPRKLRLTTEAQFKLVYKARNKTPSVVFNIYYCVNSVGHPRLGVVVPKRSVKKATTRNYFKRVIRERFRLDQHEFKSIDIVVFVNSKAEDLSKKELCLVLKNQLSKLPSGLEKH